MGRIDSDLMYDIVMQWEWGNSERLIFITILKHEKIVSHLEVIWHVLQKQL